MSPFPSPGRGFSIAFAGIVLYDYHMSAFDQDLDDFLLGQDPSDYDEASEREEDEGHPAHDMYALAHTNPRAYQQWLDAQ